MIHPSRRARRAVTPLLVASLGLGLLTTSAACRLDPGEPDYSSHVGLVNRDDTSNDPLPGPKPFDGSPRLFLGLFYEGTSTEKRVLNATRHYYIFTIENTPTLTYTQESDGDRIEGRQSDRLLLAGTPWWGGGIIWDVPEDLSAWTTLNVSFKSSDPGLEEVALRMGSGAQYSVAATNYGWVNDGSWRTLEVPLADFVAQGLDLTQVSAPFIFGGDRAGSGEALLIDDLYLSQD